MDNSKFNNMKTLLGFIAAAALIAACSVSDNMVAQILWTGGSLAVFYAVCKIYEKHYMSDEEKNERV